MKKILPSLAIVLSTFGCGANQENNSVASNPVDSMLQKENVNVVKQDNGNVMDVYQLLKAQTVKLDGDQLFEFPEIKEENGKYNIYDPAFDEPVNQAVLSSSKEKMEFTYGDYVVSVLKLGQCTATENHVAVVISNLMGNYSNYSLIVFKNIDNKLSDITSSVISFTDINKSFIALKDVHGLTSSDFQYFLKDDGSLSIKLNESKLNPVYLGDNAAAAIGQTTEEQRKLNLILSWSLNECKYLIK